MSNLLSYKCAYNMHEQLFRRTHICFSKSWFHLNLVNIALFAVKSKYLTCIKSVLSLLPPLYQYIDSTYACEARFSLAEEWWRAASRLKEVRHLIMVISLRAIQGHLQIWLICLDHGNHERSMRADKKAQVGDCQQTIKRSFAQICLLFPMLFYQSLSSSSSSS